MTSAQDLEFDFYRKDNEKIRVVAEHTYPWKPSEAMGILGFLGLGVLLTITVNPVVLGGAVIALSPYMLYLNISRKKKSAMLLADTPAGLRVYKNSIAQTNPSQFHLNDILEISTTQDLDGNSFIVLRKADTREHADENSMMGFKIPERLYSTVGGKAFIWGLAELNTDIQISDEASLILNS